MIGFWPSWILLDGSESVTQPRPEFGESVVRFVSLVTHGDTSLFNASALKHRGSTKIHAARENICSRLIAPGLDGYKVA